MGREIYEICCQQGIFNSVPGSFQGQAVAGAMEVAVEAAANLILRKQLQNLRARIALAPGRIVEEHQLGGFPRRL